MEAAADQYLLFTAAVELMIFSLRVSPGVVYENVSI